MLAPAAPPGPRTASARGRRPTWLSPGPGKIILIIGALLMVAGPVACGYFVISLYRSEVAAIRSRLEIPAHALAESTRAVAHNADVASRNIQSALHDVGDNEFAAATARQLTRYRANISLAIKRIAVYDDVGHPMADAGLKASVAEYDFFKESAGTGDDLVVSHLVADPEDGLATVVFSRRLVNREGKVRGVVAVFLDVAFLQKMFDALPMPAGTSVSAFNCDGRLLVRTPAVHLGDSQIGFNYARTSTFSSFRDSPASGGFARLKTYSGERFVAGVGSKDSPFVIAASWGVSSALAPWRTTSLAIVGGSAAVLSLVLAMLVYLRGQVRRNDRLFAHVSQAEQRQRNLVAALPDAVAIIGDSLKIEFANPAAERLYGYGPGEMNGIPITDVMASPVKDADRDGARLYLEHGDPKTTVRVLQRVAKRKDGSEFPVEISTCRFNAAEGSKLISVIRDVTVRQANDQALTRSRENLARAQKMVALGSFERDLRNGSFECSDEFLNIWGLPPGTAASLAMLVERVHPQDRESFVATRVAVLSGKAMPRSEFRIVRPDGEERILYHEYSANFDADGRPTTSFGIVQDITERKLAELALGRSRENLARAQRIAAMGSFDRDLVTGRTEWSEEFMRIWGLSEMPSGELHQHLAALVHPDDRAKFLEGRAAAIRKEPAPPLDFRITRPDGEERILHREYGAIFDDQGRAVRLFGMVQDVTERKKIETALRRSREDLARAQEVAALGSFSRDIATGKIEWSDEFLRIWGIAGILDHPDAESLAQLVHPADRKAFLQGRNAALNTKSNMALDFRITRPDGQERILHREYGVVFDEAGNAARMFGTVQDITDRKRIEIELRRHRENLDRAQRVAGIGSFERDLVTGEWEWSDELYRIHGVDRNDPRVDVAYLRNLVHPEDREKFDGVRELAAKGVAIPPIDARIIRPDGVERVLHRECELVRDSDGKPVRLVATLQDITERRRAELELQRSRENMARAQRLAAIGSFDRDLVTGTVEWSDEMFRVLALDPAAPRPSEEYLDKLVHPDDFERFDQARRAELAGKSVGPIEYRVIRADGVERIMRRESAVTFEGGKPIRLFGTLQDITERKRAELEIIQSRESMAVAQRLANMGSFDHDLVTGRVEWSDQMFRITGLDKEKIAPSSDRMIEIVHPDDREAFIAARVRSRQMSFDTFEFRIIRPDGEERFMRRESDIYFSEDGRPIRIFGTLQDITERKRAEIEIIQSRESMAVAQRIANMGSFEHDLVTGEIAWSDQMYGILGIEKNAIVPSPEATLQFVHPEDRAGFEESRARASEVRHEAYDFRIIRADGEERVLRREYHVDFADDGRPLRIFGTMQDITERRLAEARERDLERQLLHSQKLEALGTLAGGIAHDLNNTLVPIMALSKLTARRFEAGTPVRANLDTIYEASERARDLVRRVLAFSRKEEPEQQQETDLAVVVREALKLMRATVPTSIQIDAAIADVPPIPADASQIHQVITNLVSNAAGAMTNGMGTITVSLGLSAPAKGPQEICLSVADTGCGMDEATQQRIFEPFFTTKSVGQGTGLGLSIVHGIVSSHNGHIELKSAPGKGTRFALYFPLPKPAASEAATESEGEIRSSRPAA